MASDREITEPVVLPIRTKEGYLVHAAIRLSSQSALMCTTEESKEFMKTLSGDELLGYIRAATRVGEMLESKGFTVTY